MNRRLPARHQGDRGPDPHLRAAGAEVSWSGCNPLSTQDDVAAALAAEGTSIYAWHGLIEGRVLLVHRQDARVQADADARRRRRPHLHASTTRYQELAKDVIGGTEETTTGVHRLRAMGRRRQAALPGHRHQRQPRPSGTSTTSTAPASRRSTASCAPSSVLLAGKTFVVAGYGHCGRGVAIARQGHGRQRHRHRDQADRGAQGDAGGLPRHDDGRGRQARRHLHHRDRHEGHHRRPPLRRR